MAHYNVLIATPGNNVTIQYLKSLIETIKVLIQENITWRFINQYSSQVSAAREGTIMDDNFLDITNNKPLLGKDTYDTVIWIDSDISWTPQDFLKIYQSDKDITTGIYISDQGVLMYTPSDQEHLKQTQHIEITHAGFGFIGIKQGVFESIPRPWFQTQYTKTTINEQEYLIPYGEDYSFCSKARKAGHKIFVDPTVKVTHHKTIALKPK